MSMELNIFLNKSDMPNPDEWQRLIQAAGFGLQIDTDFDPFSFTGFLPCLLNDLQTGFEFYFTSKENIAGSGTYLAPLAQHLDSVVTLVWGGDPRELTAAMMASGALASSCPSLLHSPEDDSVVNGKEALGYARQQIGEVAKFLK